MFSGGPHTLIEKVSVQVGISTKIYCNKLEEISYFKIFPECFRGPLNTLWWTTCGPRAANCPTLTRYTRQTWKVTSESFTKMPQPIKSG